ncbi:kelch repeat-containing protein [Streptomyces sp. NPDC051582]|uniref:Kelch repeat-containing protein n=1 Tax=Streptomyces sp. NPDC051582 TaxID=3155167 RepID=UPI0034379785
MTVPPLPQPRAGLASTAAHCPDGLGGTCVYALSGDSTSAGFVAYSPATSVWATLPPMKTARNSLASTTAPCPGGVKGDCVYAIGGAQGNTALATNEAYSTETNAWLSLPPMPTPRAAMAAATAPCPEELGLRGACVYVFGGNSMAVADAILTTVEAYSPATNTWATLPPLRVRRIGHAGAAGTCPEGLGLHGACVYAFGGLSPDGTLAAAEVYSPVTNAWMDLPDMPTRRGDGLGGAFAPCPDGMADGCVYALGGLNGTTLDTVEAYSPAANAWVTLPSMPTPHRELGAAAAPCPKNTRRSCVYAVGGQTNNSSSDTAVVEAFAIEHTPAKDGTEPKPSTSAPEPAPFPADGLTDDLLSPVPGGAPPGTVLRDTPPAPPVTGLPYRVPKANDPS